MNADAVAHAADILIAARARGGPLAERLTPASRPSSIAEAEEVQRAIVARLKDRIAGWKVALSPEFGVMRGAILGSRMFPSGATVDAALMPGLGIEAEIAFRCDRDLPSRATEYTEGELRQSVTALVGIEIVDSRFREGTAIPAIERAADFMSNGGFVVGAPRHDWREVDLSSLAVSVVIDGKIEIDHRIGGHANRNPFVPLMPLVSALRPRGGLVAGQIVTTGTFTGVVRAKPRSTVEVVFEGFGGAAVTFS